MASEGHVLKWGVERRLEFIEFRLLWEGGVNRSDIIEAFDVSVPQASKDLALYQSLAPHNAIYDKSAKRYVAAAALAPMFLRLDADGYLSRLRSVAEGLMEPEEAWIASMPDVDIAQTPRRDVGMEVLRPILQAVREARSLEIRYQSMGEAQHGPAWRRVTPHALGHDGFRWHARAYCHTSARFKDFLLPRILEARDLGEPGGAAAADVLWQDRFGVEIGPHPDLTENQKAVVAKDYGMQNGSVVLTVRYAMLFYVLKRLGLVGDAARLPARSQHIVVINTSETDAALRMAGISP